MAASASSPTMSSSTCGRLPARSTAAKTSAPNSKQRIAVRLLLCLLIGLLLMGCNQGPPRGTVKGKVTLDGQAVDGGVITFVPADGNSQPEAVPITAGEYTVTMPVGDKRIEIY